MTKKLDINNWARKDHFYFFKQFSEPFFGLTFEVDCTQAYQKSKEIKTSFFLYYLHASIKAANQIEPFRYRIVDDEVIIHDRIDASATINRDNGTFGFSWIPYFENYEDFEKGAQKEIERVRNTVGLEPSSSSENVIHYSSIPWVKFTSLSHARHFPFPDSIPKISFGQLSEKEGIKTMPVSLHAHHALMDGFHVGQYIELFQSLLNRI